MQNDLLLIRIGFTDYDKNKTKRKDYNFDKIFKYAFDNNINFIIYYESRAISKKDVKKELIFFKSLLSNLSIYPVGIKFEDSHNTKIYYPISQNSIKKEN